MKKMCSFVLLVLLIIPAACSLATIAPLLSLPDSTFAETQNNWQGQKEYEDGGGLKILIEYTVYDTKNLLKSGEIQLADALNLSGRYIYAYQVWDHPTESTKDVILFELLDENKKAIPESAFNGDTGSHNDNTEGGVAPTPPVSTKQGVWTFVPGDLKAGAHSWFLVFSSESAPVKGNFKVSRDESDYPTPTPEPATMVLLSLGAATLLAKRKKSV